MKTIFNSYRVAAIAVFSLIAMTMFLASNATGRTPIIPVQLKFIGNFENQPLFQLSFSGTPEDNEFTLHIKDGDGYSLYKENIKGQTFSKKFLLNTDELGNAILRFEISSKKTNETVIYQVNRNTRQVEEMLISKL